MGEREPYEKPDSDLIERADRVGKEIRYSRILGRELRDDEPWPPGEGSPPPAGTD